MRRRAWIVATGVAVLAVPAAVIAGGTSTGPVESTPTGHTIWGTNGQTDTNSKRFRPIGGMPQGETLTFDYVSGTAAQVSVDLRRGTAKLRMKSNAGEGTAVEPRSVLIAGRGVRTATFVFPEGGLEEPVIEWKKVGRQTVRAASVTVDAIGEVD